MHSQVCRLNRLVVLVRIFNLAEDKNFKNRYTCGGCTVCGLSEEVCPASH